MSSAFKCDYCHEFTEKDWGHSSEYSIPKVKDKHSGGHITWTMYVDGVIKANACLPCAKANFDSLIKKIGGG